jgi:hypothetical protein
MSTARDVYGRLGFVCRFESVVAVNSAVQSVVKNSGEER